MATVQVDVADLERLKDKIAKAHEEYLRTPSGEGRGFQYAYWLGTRDALRILEGKQLP